jgi:hypothetical protein
MQFWIARTAASNVTAWGGCDIIAGGNIFVLLNGGIKKRYED